MKSYRHALACISASKKFAVNFIRWDRRGRWRNNPARVLRIFEKLSVHADVDYYGLNQDYSDEVETYHYHNDKFPRSYFDGCWLPDAKSVTTYLREWQLIREKDKAECETELLKGLAVSGTSELCRTRPKIALTEPGASSFVLKIAKNTILTP